MTRIIAGVARGRRLAVPTHGTRPTSDRAREAAFSALESRLGGLTGLTVADLYAGSGAMGLEALSRGAGRVDLVENAPGAVAVLRQNLESVGLPGGHVHAVAVERWVKQPAQDEGAADLILLDPPYSVSHEHIATVLTDLAAHGRAAPHCVVVIERPSRSGDFGWPAGFSGGRGRRYGEATLWFGRRVVRTP